MQQHFVRDLQQDNSQNNINQSLQQHNNSQQTINTLALQNSPQHIQNQPLNNPISKQNQERNDSFDESYYSYQEVDKVDNQQPSGTYYSNNLYTTGNKPLYTDEPYQNSSPNNQQLESIEMNTLRQNEIEKTKHLTHKQLVQYSLTKQITQILVPITAAVQFIALIGFLFVNSPLQYWQLIFVLLFILFNILVCLSQFEVKRFTPFIIQYALLMRHELCPLITQFVIINIYPYAFTTMVQQAFSAIMLISLLPYIALICCYCIRLIYVKSSTPGQNSHLSLLKHHSFNNKFQQRRKQEQELYDLEKRQKQEAGNSIINNRTRVEPKNAQVYSILEDAKITVLNRKDINKIVKQLIKANKQSQEQFLSLLVDIIRKYHQNILYQINLYHFGSTARNLWEQIQSQDQTMKETIFCFFNQRGDTLDYIINKLLKSSHMGFLHFIMLLSQEDLQLLNNVTQENYKQDLMRRIGNIPFFNEINTRYFFAQILSNFNSKTNIVYIQQTNQSVDTLGSAFELLKQIKAYVIQNQTLYQDNVENYKQIIFNILTKTDEMFYQKLSALVREQLQTDIPTILKQLLLLNESDILLQLVKIQHSILLNREQELRQEMLKNIPLESPIFIYYLSIFGNEFRRKLVDTEMNKILSGNYESVCMAPLILAVFGVYQDDTGLHFDESVNNNQKNKKKFGKNSQNIDNNTLINPTIQQQSPGNDIQNIPVQNQGLQNYQSIQQQISQPQIQSPVEPEIKPQTIEQDSVHVSTQSYEKQQNSIHSNLSQHSQKNNQQQNVQNTEPANNNQANQNEKSKSESTELSFSF